MQFHLAFEVGEVSHVFKFYEEQKTILGVFYEGVRLTTVNYAGPRTVRDFVTDVHNPAVERRVRASVDGNELFSMEIDGVSKRFFTSSNLMYIVAGSAGCVVLISIITIIVVSCVRRKTEVKHRYQRTEISMGTFPRQELEVCAGEYSDIYAQNPCERYAERDVQGTPHSDAQGEFVRLSPPGASIRQEDS